ncbi:hypothetical protein FACS1894166_04080 [Bacilli bacterium]|nr:hypothetical protein FACS1894166_04080 [Bacilli bacterium]
MSSPYYTIETKNIIIYMLRLNTKNIVNKMKTKQLKKYQTAVNNISKMVDLKALPGAEFLGWMDLVDSYDNHELMAMKHKADE